MKTNIKIRKMVGLSCLTAILVVLYFISSYIKIGTVEITLALFPIAIGAIIYGPSAGLFLGVINGLLVLFSPGTQSIFMPLNPIATVILCPLKTGLAGLTAGYLFKLIKKINFITAIFVSSIIVPVINTLIFSIGAMLFFNTSFEEIIKMIIAINFIIELTINTILAPCAVYLVKILSRYFNIGFEIN